MLSVDSPPFSPVNAERKKILFICGSLNQTTQMHQIAKELPEYDHHYTPFYCDGFLEMIRKAGLAEFTVLGGTFFRRTMEYLNRHKLTIDYRGENFEYDLVVRCADLIIPKNTRGVRSILVQEGMTDPKNIRFYLIKNFGILPRWLASTATMGLSQLYDKFCVASDGYKDHFIYNGISPEKLVVTGIPNFDNCDRFNNNTFPYNGYALVCTSDMRETYRFENRLKFITRAVELAAGRQLIFKLHPNENHVRARAEIAQHAPGSLVFDSGSAEEMIANCDIFITRYSSTVFVAAALGKEVYSDLDGNEIKKLAPIQNHNSARNIAAVCRQVIDAPVSVPRRKRRLRKEVFKSWTKSAILPERKKAIGL